MAIGTNPVEIEVAGDGHLTAIPQPSSSSQRAPKQRSSRNPLRGLMSNRKATTGAVILLVFLPVAIGLVAIPWDAATPIATIGMVIGFAGGWMLLGIGAIRQDRPVTLVSTGGAS